MTGAAGAVRVMRGLPGRIAPPPAAETLPADRGRTERAGPDQSGALIELRLPISVNRRIGPGFRRGGPYRAWIEEAAWSLRSVWGPKQPICEPVSVSIEANCPKNSDIDNLLKPICDALEKAGVLDNDRRIWRLAIQRSVRPKAGHCRVSLAKLAGRRKRKNGG